MDIYFTTLSSSRRSGAPGSRRGDFHELDLALLVPDVKSRPEPEEILIAIECKNTTLQKVPSGNCWVSEESFPCWAGLKIPGLPIGLQTQSLPIRHQFICCIPPMVQFCPIIRKTARYLELNWFIIACSWWNPIKTTKYLFSTPQQFNHI